MGEITFNCREATAQDIPLLAQMSDAWEKEGSCRGYRKNEEEDLPGFRIFVVEAGKEVIGYLFGAIEISKDMTAIMPESSVYFEIEELYIKPEYRSKGGGGALMKHLKNILLAENVDKIVLSTATKDYKRVFHFYIDEMGMNFWNARLFKDLKEQ